MEGELPLNRREDNILVKKLLCTAVLLFGATALRADVFSFSYSGTTLFGSTSVTGTVIATALLPNTYTITDLYGTRKGVSVSDPGTLLNGSFIYSGSSSSGLFTFLSPSSSYTVAFNGGAYTENVIIGGNNFTISRVPEVATLSLLFTMGLGVWLLARKLPSNNKTPLS